MGIMKYKHVIVRRRVKFLKYLYLNTNIIYKNTSGHVTVILQ